MLHCGARHINREQLDMIPAPAPTETWNPVPYGRLVGEVERSLNQFGLRVVNQSFGVTEGNSRMFGLLQVANGHENEDYACVVGVRGSIDKSLSEGVAVGSSVFVCDNLAFSSEIVVHRKNTLNVLRDLPVLIDASISKLMTRWQDQNMRIQMYKQKQIEEEDALRLTWRAYKSGVFPWTKGADILNEFQNPRHREFLENGHTVWTFFNAVTESLKPHEGSKASGLWSLPARTGRLHKICDDWVGLKITNSDQEEVCGELEE